MLNSNLPKLSTAMRASSWIWAGPLNQVMEGAGWPVGLQLSMSELPWTATVSMEMLARGETRGWEKFKAMELSAATFTDLAHLRRQWRCLRIPG